MLILKVFKYQKIIENKILKNVILKISKNVGCAYGYTLVCVGDKFRKLFKSYLGQDTV